MIVFESSKTINDIPHEYNSKEAFKLERKPFYNAQKDSHLLVSFFQCSFLVSKLSFICHSRKAENFKLEELTLQLGLLHEVKILDENREKAILFWISLGE